MALSGLCLTQQTVQAQWLFGVGSDIQGTCEVPWYLVQGEAGAIRLGTEDDRLK